MNELDINANNGTICLPNKFIVSSSLTQANFRNSEMFSDAQIRAPGTPPWIHYLFSGGLISNRDLYVNLCFYDQEIVYVKLNVGFYPPGPKDWSNYSLDIEAKTKNFHDKILVKILGNPGEAIPIPNMTIESSHKTLTIPFKWIFQWGTVLSTHDSKGGGTFMMLKYGNRHEAAIKDYRKKYNL